MTEKPDLFDPSRVRDATIAVLIVLCVATAVATQAQTVRQGETEPVIPHVFRSPMVIETIFAATDRATWGKRDWLEPEEYHALGEYTCDGVALRGNVYQGHKRHIGRDRGGWDAGLAMRVREEPAGILQVGIRASAWNRRHNHDKAVTLFFEVISGTAVIGSGVLGPIGTKDNETSSDGAVMIRVPIAALKAELSTKLRITMTTKDY